ncbi:MAG TPA: hypothetical protein VE177_05795, partial [Candidatus Binatus sp.]|nr:hypothetical protein [Candidatus Binatus sp.]
RRVVTGSRQKQGKLSTKRGLAGLFERYDLESTVPSGESLSLETTKDSPRMVARSIIRHYSL